MGYRDVSYIEQLWYILKWFVTGKDRKLRKQLKNSK